MVKNPPDNVRVAVSIPGQGRSPGVGNGNPLQYSCLENSMDKGAWKATVHGASKSPDMTEHTRVCVCVCVCVCIIYNFYEQISQVQTFRAQPIYISDCLLLQDIK